MWWFAGLMDTQGGIGALIIVCLLHPCPALSQLSSDWMRSGQEEIKLALGLLPNTGVARNVILMLGDGMGVSTVTAARIYKGQRGGQSGEETQLNFEKLPYVALAKTYNVDKQVPDSAGTATAFLSGVKANMGTLGVDARVRRGNCSLLREGSVPSLVQWAIEAGKAVGIVTNTRITHATPAAAYAHTPDRDWESDVSMAAVDLECRSKVKDIALQLIEDNREIKVVMGGGRKYFMPHSAVVPGDVSAQNIGGRQDGRDLIKEWQEEKARRGLKAAYVGSRQQLQELDLNSTQYLLGLFAQDHLEYEELRQKNGVVTQPTLTEMVRKAIAILSKSEQGYVLLVEGGRIDHAHHTNNALLALSETVALDQAAGVVMETTGEDTLLLVTADHSHVFTVAGYPDRGHDILGVLDPTLDEAALDGMPYATLAYVNGPGPGRVNLTAVATGDPMHQQSRLVPLHYETHGGEDVAVYARGPMAHLLHGVHEQHYVAHVAGYAACLGIYSRCDRSPSARQSPRPWQVADYKGEASGPKDVVSGGQDAGCAGQPRSGSGPGGGRGRSSSIAFFLAFICYFAVVVSCVHV